jgi:hypothetical protein
MIFACENGRLLPDDKLDVVSDITYPTHSTPIESYVPVADDCIWSRDSPG